MRIVTNLSKRTKTVKVVKLLDHAGAETTDLDNIGVLIVENEDGTFSPMVVGVDCELKSIKPLPH
jgi:hypothetical protein